MCRLSHVFLRFSFLCARMRLVGCSFLQAVHVAHSGTLASMEQMLGYSWRMPPALVSTVFHGPRNCQERDRCQEQWDKAGISDSQFDGSRTSFVRKGSTNSHEFPSFQNCVGYDDHEDVGDGKCLNAYITWSKLAPFSNSSHAHQKTQQDCCMCHCFKWMTFFLSLQLFKHNLLAQKHESRKLRLIDAVADFWQHCIHMIYNKIIYTQSYQSTRKTMIWCLCTNIISTTSIIMHIYIHIHIYIFINMYVLHSLYTHI